MRPSQILIEAKALITDPSKWVQGVAARNVLGEACDPISEHAACFCSLGAIHRVLYMRDIKMNSASHIRSSDALHNAFSLGVVKINDTCKHSTVMKFWDEAIAIAKDGEMVG